MVNSNIILNTILTNCDLLQHSIINFYNLSTLGKYCKIFTAIATTLGKYSAILGKHCKSLGSHRPIQGKNTATLGKNCPILGKNSPVLGKNMGIFTTITYTIYSFSTLFINQQLGNTLKIHVTVAAQINFYG